MKIQNIYKKKGSFLIETAAYNGHNDIIRFFSLKGIEIKFNSNISSKLNIKDTKHEENAEDSKDIERMETTRHEEDNKDIDHEKDSTENKDDENEEDKVIIKKRVFTSKYSQHQISFIDKNFYNILSESEKMQIQYSS